MELKDEKLVKKLDIELNKNFEEALNDANFKKLCGSLKRPKKELMKITSKLENTCKECLNCKNCKGLFECSNSLEGHISYPKVIENKIVFTYIPCKFELEVINKNTNIKTLTKVTMKDIDTKDKKQLKVIKWMDDFYENFSVSKNMKGLYLHGSFGSGKTYLLTALLNELKEAKKINTKVIYFADTLRDLKDDFYNFSYKMQELMNTDILLFDDIGAEKVTDWSRDEVLAPILQYRMDNYKTTFFTSNLTIDELEAHLSISSNGVDKVKSRRIIERIKQLTYDLELLSENRRK